AIGEARPVPVADIEAAVVRVVHVGDQREIAAQPAGGGSGGRLGGAGGERQGRAASHAQKRGRPRCSAHPVRNPRKVANSSGSCSRKASCPLSVSISTKLTLAATALSACTSARLSGVGNSQSLVNEMMQKRG